MALAQPQAQTQPKVVDQAVNQASAQGPANFPLILPQRRQLPAVARHWDSDSFDSYSINLDNNAVLREKQAQSEVLDRVAEFYGLARANAETSRKKNSTTQIARRNYEIVNGRLAKSLESLNPGKPWGLRDHFTGSGYYTYNAEGYVPKPESLLVPSRPPPAQRTAICVCSQRP